MTAAERLNQYLASLFDVLDPVYKSIIANVDGVPAGTINKPTDYNSGAVANLLEYGRQMGIDLVAQMYFDQNTGKYHDFYANEVLGIPKFTGETEAQHKSRAQDYVMAKKISKAAIIFASRPFSVAEPEILVGGRDDAYADISFSDQYQGFVATPTGTHMDNWFIFPARAGGKNSSAYFFTLIVTGTTGSDVPKLVELLDRWVAAGIEYAIQIN